MSDSMWPQQLAAMRRRIATLYRSAASDSTQRELLPVAFEELQNALEELEAMYEDLRLQHEHILDTRERVETEFQTYQDLFASAPVAYLSTSLNGTIRHANRAAAALFQTAERAMIGRSLALFVPEGERRAFRACVEQLPRSQDPQLWEARMQPWGGTSFQAALTTSVAYGPLGHPTVVRWIVEDIATREQPQGQRQASQAPLEERERMVGANGLE